MLAFEIATGTAATTTMFHHISTVVHNSQHQTLFSPFPIFPSTPTPRKFQSFQTLKFPRNWNLRSFSLSQQQDDDSEESVIGDCVVFEEGIFEDPLFQNDVSIKPKLNSKKKKKKVEVIKAENLVPDKWREVQAEINITKKDRRRIAREIEFNSKVDKKKRGLVPLRDMDLDDYKAYKEAKLAQLKPLVLDRPPSFSFAENEEVSEGELSDESDGERVEPKNPRWAVYGRGLEDVEEFFNSEKYDHAAAKNTEGNRREQKKEGNTEGNTEDEFKFRSDGRGRRKKKMNSECHVSNKLTLLTKVNSRGHFKDVW